MAGLRWQIRDSGAQHRGPDGPVVILQHGFSSSSAMNWEAPGVVAALVKAGRRVVALDARGHGQSASPHDTVRYTRTAMARDISEAANVLGAERYDLAGYSMGGMVGVITAATSGTAPPRGRQCI